MTFPTTLSEMGFTTLLISKLLQIRQAAECSYIRAHFLSSRLADIRSLFRNYVDQATAQALNLTFASDSNFILRTDDTTVLSTDGPGRNSVRIRSNNYYSTHVAMSVIPGSLSTKSAIINFLIVSTSSTCHKAAGEYLIPD